MKIQRFIVTMVDGVKVHVVSNSKVGASMQVQNAFLCPPSAIARVWCGKILNK